MCFLMHACVSVRANVDPSISAFLCAGIDIWLKSQLDSSLTPSTEDSTLLSSSPIIVSPPGPFVPKGECLQ